MFAYCMSQSFSLRFAWSERLACCAESWKWKRPLVLAFSCDWISMQYVCSSGLNDPFAAVARLCSSKQWSLGILEMGARKRDIYIYTHMLGKYIIVMLSRG